ncbi:phospho-sugar mutase [Treponema sp. OMZ 840]|uniref:phospho-sugar mutase n=1 Tax=Treponema sp. OMZ 840 TaxID=244313 RepID=UPI003D8C4A62
MDKNEIIARAKAYIEQETDGRFRTEVEKLLKKGDMNELTERFYQSLEFGTGGLRGIIGGGTNRMNTLMIHKATQGLANYCIKAMSEKAAKGELKAAIAYDSRRYSDVFAEAAACIFAANGFTVYLFTGLRPTPELSYIVREYGCITGVVVTASHNPPQYNGYKAYWADGAQVTPPHDKGIIDEVNKVESVRIISKEEAVKQGKIILVDSEVDEKYWTMCKNQLFRPALIKEKAKEVRVVYTPLHGTGAMHVEKVLGDLGLTVITVPEQRSPDGNFPTVEKPNPEEAPALKMAIDLAKKEKADAVMATDPDSDRFGSAVPDSKGNWTLINGNQMGVLLADYIIVSRKELNKMPQNPAIIRSIVTSPMVDYIAKANGVHIDECLTGFKWIASVMNEYDEKQNYNYIFGFEESYGYNVETEVRDKDGISAAAMCAEMTLYWRSQGKSLLERLEELYKTYGYFEDRAVSKTFLGASGGETMKKIMAKLRAEGLKTLGGKKVLKIRDIGDGVAYNPENPNAREKLDLPSSNVLQFFLEDGTIVSARPSGTEPKIKFYINAVILNTPSLAEAKKTADALCSAIEKEIQAVLDAA